MLQVRSEAECSAAGPWGLVSMIEGIMAQEASKSMTRFLEYCAHECTALRFSLPQVPAGFGQLLCRSAWSARSTGDQCCQELVPASACHNCLPGRRHRAAFFGLEIALMSILDRLLFPLQLLTCRGL